MITFRSKSQANITMLDVSARQILQIIGHSGTVPSAIAAEDLPGALAKLRLAVEAAPSDHDVQEDSENETVGLARRAFPIVQLFEQAIEQGEPVMWDQR